MIIGLNLLPFHPDAGQGGTESMIRNLIDGLTRTKRDHQFILLVGKDVQGHYLPIDPRFEEYVCPISHYPQWRRVLFEQLMMPFWCRGMDVVYSQFISLLLLPKPQIVTIHDTIHVRYPEFIPSRTKRLYWNTLMPLSARASRLILTDSRYSALEIMNAFGVSSAKIRIIQPGMKSSFLTTDNKISSNQPYILCTSAANFSHHKNIPILLRAFKKLADIHHDLNLVITGKPTPLKLSTVESEAPELLAQGRIQLTGFVSENKLRDLYRGASACVVPSLYEGLGLPVLEAQALRCPVVVSDCASLPEIHGNPDLIFRHEDPDSLAALCHRLLTDTAFRLNAQNLGTNNLPRFDNLTAAEAFLDACEAIY
jgi:glycosyltransferase involved in cell wall biosynthesis